VNHIEDGGPAFPSGQCYTITDPVYGYTTKHSKGPLHLGISQRDWFAANASEEDIQEFLPQTIGEEAEFTKKFGFKPTRQWARYQHADAMLAARKET
jgi:hypothetical protein